MKLSFFRVLAAASISVFSLSAIAQLAPVEGINFKLGDDVQTVKNSLKTSIDPEPTENASLPGFPNASTGKTNLFLRTKGIRVFFTKAGVVESIKFEPPFAGSIAGVKLGDTEKKVRDLRGKPVKTPWQFGASQAFLYALDDTSYIRFDINESDGVQTIFIQK